MLCDKCKKKQATIVKLQIINDNITEYNLCEECASTGNMPFETIFKHIMNSLIGLSDNFEEHEEEKIFKDIKCPGCGLTYEGFKSLLKLGCSDCYNTFRNQLTAFFKNMQGNVAHTGKLPVKSGAQLIKLREADHLKKHLKKLIDSEEFEEAAKIRDKIKALTNNEVEGAR